MPQSSGAPASPAERSRRLSPSRSVAGLVLSLASLAFLGGCVQEDSPTWPDVEPVATLDIVDGPRGGNPDFAWLPPTVPGASEPTAPFDATALDDLRVEICLLGEEGVCKEPLVAAFTSKSFPVPSRIRLDQGTESYVARWLTGPSRVDPAYDYRVVVLRQGLPLGSLDVDVVRNARELQAVDTSRFVGVVRGQPLDLRFRIQEAIPVARVVVNEVESNGGTPGDWVELYNAGTAPADLSGYGLKDDNDSRTFTIAPGTTLEPGAFLVLDEAQFNFGLGAADIVRLFAPDGVTLVDSFAWTSHAATTYGRCPDGTGAFATTSLSTKGTANLCLPDVRINEIESDGESGDWVEFVNFGDSAVGLSGFQVRGGNDARSYTVPSGTMIQPGEFLVLTASLLGFGLESSDAVRLFLPGGTIVVDQYAWTAHAATTWGRCPDGAGPFTLTLTPTKGTANDCPVPSTDVKINEVESNGGTPGDWVELYNIGSTAVDLSGYGFKDNDDSRTFTIAAGTVIQPGGFLVLEEADFGFGLGAGDAARLFAPDGVTVLDSYVWTAHATTTYGRCPDGTGEFFTTELSTKGAANRCRVVLPDVRLNEIESSGGTPGDWVELFNFGTVPVDLSGYGFKDNDDSRTFTITAGTVIQPGGLLVLDEAQFGFGLGAADAARLFAPDGVTVVDSYTWTTHAATTYGRCTDGTGPFLTTTAPTKGALNSCPAPTATVVVNEVESSGGVPGDWVELFNNGTQAVDLSGYFFKDNDDSRTFTIAAGTAIQPGSFLVLEEAQFGFGLGAADAARLFAPDGVTLVSSYTWTAHAATTYGRCPDGTGEFFTTTTSTKGAANDCRVAVVVNEVESSGGVPGDWVEFFNPSPLPVDLGGYIFRDNNDAAGYVIPAGTSIAGGGYLVLDEAQFGFGLGAADAARLFAPNGTTLVDGTSWTTHATTTYGRCPNGTGAFATTAEVTKGAANVCPGEVPIRPWPGTEAIQVVDAGGVFNGNLSGLAYQGSGSATPGVLWAARNGPGSIFRLLWDGAIWTPDAVNQWGMGKLVRYPDGTGEPDAEGITFLGSGATVALYLATERNNQASGVSRNSILRFDAGALGNTLVATHEWNVTSDIPATGPNLGLEAITFIPDAFLVGAGFRDESTGAAYNPALYPDHAGGLFFVGVEATGMIYAYALNHANSSFVRVASIASGFAGVMGLEFDAELGILWATCDDGCGGQAALLEIDDTPGAPTEGRFVVTTFLARPGGMPNVNNEGFALTPLVECVGGVRPVLWADDNETGGNALRRGGLTCSP